MLQPSDCNRVAYTHTSVLHLYTFLFTSFILLFIYFMLYFLLFFFPQLIETQCPEYSVFLHFCHHMLLWLFTLKKYYRELQPWLTLCAQRYSYFSSATCKQGTWFPCTDLSHPTLILRQTHYCTQEWWKRLNKSCFLCESCLCSF